MFCTKCSIENSKNALYCYNCGTELPEVAQMASEPPHVTDESIATGSIQEPSRQSGTSEPNFLVRHWRGDYSLAISYWVIGSLLTVIVVALTTTIGSSDGVRELGPRASGAIVLVFYIFVIPFTLWQIVGIWRSADKHSQKGGRAFWAGLAKVMVFLGILRAAGEFATQGIPILSEGAKLLVGIENTPPHQIRLLRDGTELELSGGMPFGTANAIRKFLDAAPAIQVIHLNSNGGRMNEAYQLYRTIKERGLTTYTSGDCVSACSLAFLAGRERYLGEDGRLGFHSTSIGELSGEIAGELNDEVRRTLRTHGVPSSFIDRAMATSPKDMWYPSTDELLAAKVIDSVVDSRYFGLSGVSQWRDAHKLESGLLTVPIYSALAQYDPTGYAKLREILVAGIQKGRAPIEIQNDIRALFVGQLIPAYLRKAPDEALIRYWHSQIAEMKHLASVNPQHCADFLFPQFARSTIDLQNLLTKDLQREDLEALAAVVEGVSTNPQTYSPDQKIDADLEAAVMRIMRKYPGALDVVQSPADYRNDPEVLCAAITIFYSEILAIPSASRSGAVLRYILQ